MIPELDEAESGIAYGLYAETLVRLRNSSEEMDLIEADNKLTRTSYPGDAFPGTDGITSFTNCTRPAMKTWTGDVFDLPITEIAESRRGVVSFKVAGGLEPSAVPEALAAAEVGSYSFKARWRPVPNAVKYAVSISMEGVDDYVLVEEVPAEAAELLVSDRHRRLNTVIRSVPIKSAKVQVRLRRKWRC